MAKVSLSSAISRRRSHCSGRYQLTPMSNVLLSRCFLMVCHIFHCCRLLSMIHPPSQRHLMGYDANDHVASTSSFPRLLAMIPRFGVSHVSHSRCLLICGDLVRRDERDGRDGMLRFV